VMGKAEKSAMTVSSVVPSLSHYRGA
jgi:hypothetical protein